jgi:hypothetical protein
VKNLLIFTREDGQFSEETKTLVKIQIENSLNFFDAKDVMLVTNFEYEFGGVKATVIPDTTYRLDRTNKIPAIVHLLQNDLPPETYWYHDFDAFQDEEINVDTELAFTGYGYKKHWNCGSFFFKPSAKPTIEYWNSLIATDNRADEKTLTVLTSTGLIPGNKYEELGIEYNYNEVVHHYPKFDHVVPKVLHFHPGTTYYRSKDSNLNIFMYGKNRLKRPLMSDRLIKIFQKHGIR